MGPYGIIAESMQQIAFLESYRKFSSPQNLSSTAVGLAVGVVDEAADGVVVGDFDEVAGEVAVGVVEEVTATLAVGVEIVDGVTVFWTQGVKETAFAVRIMNTRIQAFIANNG